MVSRVIGGGGLLHLPYVGRSRILLESDFSGKWEFHVEAEPHYHPQDQKSQQEHQQPHQPLHAAQPKKNYSFITNNKWIYSSSPQQSSYSSTNNYCRFNSNISNFSASTEAGRIKITRFICSGRTSSKSLQLLSHYSEEKGAEGGLIICLGNRRKNEWNSRNTKGSAACKDEGVFLGKANYRNNNGLIWNGVAPQDALRHSFKWQ
jgi:hypothetical protein